MFLFIRSMPILSLVRLLFILFLASFLNSCQQSKPNPQNDSISLNQDSAVIINALLESLNNEGSISSVNVPENNISSSILNKQSVCATLTYDKELVSRRSNLRIYLKEVTARDLGLSRGYHTFTQPLNKASGSSLLISFIFHYHNNTITLLSKASPNPNASTGFLVTGANINPNSQYWIGVLTNESWNFPPLQISGNCQTTISAPVFSHVSPNPVPVNASRQWIEIHGSNFVNPVTVDLVHNNQRYRIPSDRYRFVNSRTIKVFAGITQGGEWGIDIYNPNGKSSSGKFHAQYSGQASSKVDGFDYPIGNRGYQNGREIAMDEHIHNWGNGYNANRNEEYNKNINVAANNYRGARRRGNYWHNLSDLGNYVAANGGIHSGEDWNYGAGANYNENGAAIYAVANGVIKSIRPVYGSYRNSGWLIAIEHTLPNNSKVSSYYLHVTSASSTNGTLATSKQAFGISEGDIVKRGQLIARIATGMTRVGPHLHFEMRKRGYSRSIYSNTYQGYYTDSPRVPRKKGMTKAQVLAAFNLMRQEGIIDPSDFIDDNRPSKY